MEDHYSSEDEEVFFGSLAGSEISRRRHFLGDNYNSPVTPRAPRFNLAPCGIKGNVPDVLGASSTSTPVQRQPLIVSSGNNHSTISQHDATGVSSLAGSDDDVIVLDHTGNLDSVIILSDDESFIINEKSCARMLLRSNEGNQSLVKELGCTSEMSNKSETVDVSKLHHESVFVDEDFITDSVTSENKSPSKSDINKSKNRSLQSHSSSLKNVETNNLDMTGNKSNDSICSVESGSLCFVEDILQIDIVENGNMATSSSEVSNKDVTDEVDKICNESIFSDKIYITESVMAEDKNLQKSSINDFGNFLNHNSLFNNVQTNNNEGTRSEVCESYMNKSSSSLVQHISDFVGDLSIHEKCSAPVNHITVDDISVTLNDPQNLNLSAGPSSLEGKAPNNSSCIASDSTPSVQPTELQKNTKIIGEITNKSTKNCINSSFDMSGLSNLEFSLNGITDSILNISHGSSLPSLPETHLPSSPLFQKPNMYEDISYDDGQLEDSSNTSNIANKNNQENEDLHMSVDEVSFQRRELTDDFSAYSILGTSIDTSQPSEYKSCPSSQSSYSTAATRTCAGNPSTSEQSDAFQNYRDISSDLNMCEETNLNSIITDEETVNERSFEISMQNSATPVYKKTNTNKEEPKTMSKLPVYQNSKSLLRSPKLHVKSDTLKTTSYKFAKQISKLESEKCTSNIPRPGLLKLTGPKALNPNKDAASVNDKKTHLVKGRTFTKTPAKKTPSKQNLSPKTKTPMPTSSLTKLKTPSLSYLPVLKTPDILSKTQVQNTASKTPANLATKKTPAQNKSGIPKAVKSDSKVMRLATPLSRCYSTERIGGSSQKNKYKNVISPIHAYIRGSPPVPLRNAKVKDEEHNIYGPDGNKIYQSTSKNIIPMTSQNAPPMKSAPKAVQMLKYDNATQGQENVNPNVINLTRDTIPCKVLEPSLQVFWKEQEEPRLPKMGEKLTKILAGTPKIKLTAHKGRVNQSPSSNGILVPNKENSPSSLITPSASSHTSDTDNLHEGRISIRVQKTLELP